jgi:DNA-binding GntR family transcriptional regulator
VSTANETRRFAKDWRRFFNAARAFGDAFAPASAPVALETSLRMLRRRRLRIWGMGGGEEEGRRRRRARRQI